MLRLCVVFFNSKSNISKVKRDNSTQISYLSPRSDEDSENNDDKGSAAPMMMMTMMMVMMTMMMMMNEEGGKL